MKLLLGLALLIPSVVLADSTQVQIADYLSTNTVLPLLGNTAEELAGNLLQAQVVADLDQPDSLQLSADSVLRAIWIEKVDGGMTECDPTNCNIVWVQSMIAINDLAHVSLTPPVLNFGDVPVTPTIATPEPPSGELILGLGLWLVCRFFRKRRGVSLFSARTL